MFFLLFRFPEIKLGRKTLRIFQMLRMKYNGITHKQCWCKIKPFRATCLAEPLKERRKIFSCFVQGVGDTGLNLPLALASDSGPPPQPSCFMWGLTMPHNGWESRTWLSCLDLLGDDLRVQGLFPRWIPSESSNWEGPGFLRLHPSQGLAVLCCR